MRRLALLAAVLGEIAAAQVPPRAPSCRADSDCVLTRFSGCCPGCGCGASLHAVAAAELSRSQARCAQVDCAMKQCAPVRCAPSEPESALRAVCRAGTCEAVRAALPAASCRADADCTVVYPAPPCRPGPCGCCPGTVPVAVPVAPDEEDRRPTRLVEQPGPTKPATEVTFGLSPGGPTPPACAPCPAPNPAQARCSAGRCVVEPRAR